MDSDNNAAVTSIETLPDAVKLKALNVEPKVSEKTKKGTKKSIVDPPGTRNPNQHADDDDEDDEEVDYSTPSLQMTPFFTQLYYVTKKNLLLLYRRPVMMAIYLSSSVISMIFAWAVARDSDDAIYEDFDDCGKIPYSSIGDKYDYEEISKVQHSLNENWRDGLAITLMGLGPMVNAIMVLLILHGEISSQLLGTLRALGLCDSVYWISWYLCFGVVSLGNSLLGSITGKLLPTIHGLESIYMGGIFASLLLLQLALTGSSFFLASVLGTAKCGLAWMILIVLIACWIPYFVLVAQSDWYLTHSEYPDTWSSSWAAGLFWEYKNTYSYQLDFDPSADVLCVAEASMVSNNSQWNDCIQEYYITQSNITVRDPEAACDEQWPNGRDYSLFSDAYRACMREYNVWDTCNVPVMNQEQGEFWKTTEEQKLVTPDEYFVGCYAKASWPTAKWSVSDKKKSKEQCALFFMYLFPYFHFQSIWGNFFGYTQMPNRKFANNIVNLSPEKLAIQGLPSPPDPSRGLDTTFFPQGSTVKTDNDYFICPPSSYPCEPKTNCPLVNNSDYCNGGDSQYYYNPECSYARAPVPTESKSVLQLFGHLIAVACMYLFLAAYWAQVFPGGNGKAQPFYFFLLPRYWFQAKEDNQSGDNGAFDQESDLSRCASLRNSMMGGGSVVVDSVKKSYGKFEAIKGMSLNMLRNEVTALLGHNGAGKTTLSHILCCEIAPSDGDVFIFGHSVMEDPYSVRNLVGLCKQDDYLWPDLTAKEHLELYAGLRGVPAAEIGDRVQQWLKSVDLVDNQLDYSSSFSGGMKRRLSVALSTIGDRPLIILDEPTTGMDPVSRRFVWRHIDEIKKGRVILLTTHAMEEADLLADEVAIMRKGELAASGTPLQLKAEHGSALQFSILVDKSDVESTEVAVKGFFAGTPEGSFDFEIGEAGNVTLTIHKIDQGSGQENGVPADLLSKFVAWLVSDESGVTEYGFSNSSLEEVFLKVTDADEEEQIETDDSRRGCCCVGCCLYRCCSKSQQDDDLDLGIEDEAINAMAPEKSKFEDIASFQPKLCVRNQVPALIADFAARAWTGRNSSVNYIIFGILFLGNIFIGLTMANSYNPAMAFVLPVVTLSLIMIPVITPIYSDRAEGLFYLMRTQGLIPRSYLLGTSIYAFLVQLVFAFLILTTLFVTPIFRSPYVCKTSFDDSGNDDWWYGYSGSGGDPECSWDNTHWTDRQKVYPENIRNFDEVYNDEPVILQAVREPGGFGMIIGIVFCFALTYPGAVLSSSYIPGYKFPLVFISFLVLCAGLAPMFHVLLGFNDIDGFIKCKNITDPNDVCQSSFNSSNVDADFVNCAAYELNSDGLASFCIPPSAALLPQYGLYQMLSMTHSSKIKFISEPAGFVQDVLIPQLDNHVQCSGDICTVPRASTLYGLNFLYMIIGSVVLLILGIAVSFTCGFPCGIVLKLRHALVQMFDALLCRRIENNIEVSSGNGSSLIDDAELSEVSEEREVVSEIIRHRTEGPNSTERIELAQEDTVSPVKEDGDFPPVVGSNLTKLYPSIGGRPPKVALRSLDLHVPKGQVLGFLGRNGAGKTTALKILAGAHDPTDGIGLVAGFDCATERIQVFERLGNCPQFDVIWDNRTVQNHLEFFARLKGLPAKQISSISRSIATAVGLGSDAFYHRNAGALSGGMRRRLSIAMALIGSPAVVILDEPTTGLDPSTRSSIWALVNSFATQERSMIITTHMMIEADTLCNRIAIISRGKLKVVGTQQHLKDEFGLGYLLQLNLIKSTLANQENAMAFVRDRLHPGAVLGTKQAKTLHLHLPRDLDLQNAFQVLYSPEVSSEGGINQFLLSQSSLEDVFVSLGGD